MTEKNLFSFFPTSNAENHENHDLKYAKYDELPEYELDGCHDCKIVRVWDGDTLFAAIPYKDKIYRVNCRLMDVDTPEIPRNYSLSMTDDSKSAYLARDKIVEYLTNIDTEPLQKLSQDSTGNTMPSLTSHDLQYLLDQNTLILPQSLTFHGRDKYGRYLVRIKTKTGEDLSQKLIEENLAKPFMVQR